MSSDNNKEVFVYGVSTGVLLSLLKIAGIGKNSILEFSYVSFHRPDSTTTAESTYFGSIRYNSTAGTNENSPGLFITSIFDSIYLVIIILGVIVHFQRYFR